MVSQATPTYKKALLVRYQQGFYMCKAQGLLGSGYAAFGRGAAAAAALFVFA